MAQETQENIIDTTAETVPVKYNAIETGVILSKSIIWDLQRKYFTEKGIEAWANNVPFYISSNVYIAAFYAETMGRYIQECKRKGMIDPAEPVYILEMGAGHGKFGFHFVTALADIIKGLELTDLKITYVLTDFCQPNVDHWRKTKQFQPFLDKGLVDFGIFDCDDPNVEIRLQHSNRLLRPGSVKNPIGVIANYYFDTIRYDYYKIENGQLHEGLTNLLVAEGLESPTQDINKISNLQITHDYRPIDKTNYAFGEINTIIEEYKSVLKTSKFLIPVGGFTAINNLQKIANGRLLILSGDKGGSTLDDLEGQGDPYFNFHGSFSMSVNFHALGRYCELRGGSWDRKDYNHTFSINCFTMGLKLEDMPETRYAYHTWIQHFGPDDLYNFKQPITAHVTELTFDMMMAYLKAVRWDTNVFLGLKEQIINSIEQLNRRQKEALIVALDRLDKNFYYTPASTDSLVEIGRVYHMMGDYAKAKTYYYRSLSYYGKNWALYHNLGLVYYFSNNPQKSSQYFKKALALNPEAKDSTDWLNFLKNQKTDQPAPVTEDVNQKVEEPEIPV